MAKTFSEWIATLSAVTGLGAGDKVPVVEGGTAKYVEGDDLGGGITALTGDVTASGTGIVVASIATGVIVNADVNASAAIDATKIADGTVSNAEFQYLNGVTSAVQTQLDGKVDENAAIVGATKTKITYDTKGLVTAGADATTADIADSIDKRYVTDAQLVVIGNTSGTNTGDQNLSGLQPLDSDLTTIAGLTPSNDDFIQRKAGAWANRTIAQVKTDLGVPTYARYVALLTQTSTNAPVATVLENTLGGTVVWTYDSVGYYIGTLSAVFTANKTTLSIANNTSVADAYSIAWIDANSVGIESGTTTPTNEDDKLNNTFIEIRVYP